MDTALGEVLQQLESDGLTDSTIVFYFGDHGNGMPRGKRWLYQSGLRVPLLISVPEKFRHLTQELYKHGGTSNQLTSFIDLAPTVLQLCNVPIPNNFQGTSIFSKTTSQNRYLYGFRDRMDERYDCSRAIRDEQFLYIRNFMPHRPQGQYLEYMYQTPSTIAWLKATREIRTTDAQSLFWKLKPCEELYDLNSDRDQLINLAEDKRHQSKLSSLREQLKSQLIDYRDLGFVPEALMQKMIASNSGEAITAWDLGNSQTRLDVPRIIETAFTATAHDVDTSKLEALARSNDEAIRYWAAIAFLYQGLNGKWSFDFDPAQNGAIGKIRRCPICGQRSDWALGSSDQRQEAIGRIIRLAEAPDQSPYAQMHLFDSLTAMNLNPSELPTGLEQFAQKTTNVPPRYDTYIQRSIEAIKKLAVSPELHVPLK